MVGSGDPTVRQGDSDGSSPMTLSVSDLLSVLLGSLRLIAVSVFVGLAAGVLVSLVQSPVYRAQATLLPEQSSSRSSLTYSTVERLAYLPLSSRSPQLFYATILRSRAIAEVVSERLGLAEWLEVPGPLAKRERLAVSKLRRIVRVTEAATTTFYRGGGLITVSVESDDPIRAADIANTYLFALDEHLTENAMTSASRLRRFLERRLEETNRELEEAQVNLQAFQEKHGAINIDEQAAATIQLLSELEAERVILSVDKVAQEERYSAAHSSVRTLQAKIGALQEVIDRLTYSQEPRVPYEREGRVEFFVPLKMIPELSFEASRKLLALKSKGEIVSLFATRLEQAKIDEASNLPSVSVLDLARVGVRVRPRALFNLAIGMLMGLIVGCGLSWGRHYGRRAAEGVDVESPLGVFLRRLDRVSGGLWGRIGAEAGRFRLGFGRRGGGGSRRDHDIRDG